MLALKKIGTIEIAVKGSGVEVPELGVVDVTRKLGDRDLHFGIAFPEDNGVSRNAFFNFFKGSLPKDAEMKGGPRQLDVLKRGGHLAENWEDLPEARRFLRDAVDKPVGPGKRRMPPGARIGGVAVGGVAKYSDYGGAETKGDVSHDNPTVAHAQMFTRSSKAALECALAGGHVHFHLEGMGALSQLINKAGNYSHNITSRELRYVMRNWDRFKGHVTFYNGYTASGVAVMVEPPWLPAWQPDSSAKVCTSCKAEFGVMTRKHHCRRCGRIFCDNCTQKKVVLYNPGNGEYPVRRPGGSLETGSVRVCVPCFTGATS